MKFDQPQTLRLLKSISGDGDGIAEQGERAAEQATMALDSLFIAYTKNGKLAQRRPDSRRHQRVVPSTGRSVRVQRLPSLQPR